MDKNFYTPDNIEAFIENRLNANEKALFEAEISKDPLLKNELNLQKDIIDSLKSYRKLELKNRLNNIEVNASSSYTGVKIAASILITAALGLGLYTYLDKEEAQVPQNSISVNAGGEVEQFTQVAPQNTPETENNKAEASKKETGAVTKTETQKITSGENIAPASEDPQYSAPVIIENFEDPFLKDEEISLPQGQIAQTVETKSGIEVKIDNSTANKFHYKFNNKKLYLLGDFDSKTYEILELNSYKGKQMYLYYNNSYYQLNHNKTEASPLQNITDPKLIDELDKFNN